MTTNGSGAASVEVPGPMGGPVAPSAPGAPAEAARRLDLGMLREAMKHLDRAALRDGTWFKSLIVDHVKKHQAAISPATWDAAYPGLDAEARVTRHITGVARKASLAGALASLGASMGEILALVTEGLAAPVGVPAAMLSMGLEAAYTALLQIDLACDLASIQGVAFDPEDAGEIATIFAVALAMEPPRTDKRGGPEKAARPAGAEPSEGEGLEALLIDLEEGEIATRIGRKLIEESVMRNIVPFVGIAVSARWNYAGTVLLGKKANRYIRYRRAIRRAFSRVDCAAVADPMLLIEGAWLLSTADGGATHEELMAIALLADVLGAQRGGDRLDTTLARIDDEDEWLERVARSPASSHDAILETLSLVAATDRELQTGERRLLRRVGKALGRTVDFARIEQICAHFADGDDLPAAAAAAG
jgi:uncharacterized protein (DUF697 family)